MLLEVVAGLTYLMPWTKIPVCRAHFILSSLVMFLCAIAGIAIGARHAHPVYLIIAGWLFYLPGMLMHIFVIASLDRGYRIHGPGFINKPDLDGHMPVLH